MEDKDLYIDDQQSREDILLEHWGGSVFDLVMAFEQLSDYQADIIKRLVLDMADANEIAKELSKAG